MISANYDSLREMWFHFSASVDLAFRPFYVRRRPPDLKSNIDRHLYVVGSIKQFSLESVVDWENLRCWLTRVIRTVLSIGSCNLPTYRLSFSKVV